MARGQGLAAAKAHSFLGAVTRLKISLEGRADLIADLASYGLSASIWTRDIGRALRMARAIRSGVVSVNSNHSVHQEAPFGGVKMSGFGRELGMHALELYTEVKNVFVAE